MTLSFCKNLNRIGLIADSHGSLEAVPSCINRLKQLHADAMVHLGDIFDSLYNDNLYETITTIQQNNIFSVKGNNDYQIEKMLSNGHQFDISAEEKKKIISFLKKMPMKLVEDNICFTHSLPFDSVRSFYEPVDTGFTDRAELLFEKTPYQIIFCGHSHTSVLFRWRKGRVTREKFNLDQEMFLDPSERYIIIVGSAENGECGFFDKEKRIFTRVRTGIKAKK